LSHENGGELRNPFWALENIETTPKRKLFTLFGVDWLATRRTWLSLPFYAGVGLGMGLLGKRSGPISAVILDGLGYALALYLSNTAHSLGHLLSGKIMGAPMDANLLTATFDVNLYFGDQSKHVQMVHIGRALGGPLMNLLLGLIGIGLWKLLEVPWVKTFGLINLLSAVLILTPVAPLDGWVLWTMLTKRK
jgi:hypothetical protein